MNLCPFCSSKETKSSVYEDTTFNEKVFEYLKCATCSLVYVSPMPDSDDLLVMYPPTYQGAITSGELSKRDVRRVLRTIKQNPGISRLLDFGCGNGSFLRQIHEETGIAGVGVEFDEQVTQSMNKVLAPLTFKSVDSFFNSDELYDMIYLSNVLEHLISPKETMEALKKRLSPHGIIVIEGPIEENFTLALKFRQAGFYLKKHLLKKKASHAPYHIFYANKKNQWRFFKELGIEEVDSEIIEDPWPFPSQLKHAKGVKGVLFYLIARFSILVDSLAPDAGNSFYFVGKKT